MTKEETADILAKKWCGIKNSADMNSAEEKYYNPRYREYCAYVAGYLQSVKDK